MQIVYTRIRTIHMLIAAAVLIAVAAGFAVMPKAFAASDQDPDEKLITVHDRGQEKGFITTADTLRVAFEEEDIALDRNDIVEPGLDEELTSNNYQVNIYRARPIVIEDGMVKLLVMSAYQTPKQIAAHADIELRDEDDVELSLTDNFVRDGASVRMIIDRAKAVRLTLYGKTETVYTQAATVSDFMNEKNIKLGPNDDMSVESDDRIREGARISIWRDGKQTVTRKQSVAFETQTIQDPNRDPSYRKVNTPGKKGSKMVTYEIVMRNGREVSRKVIQQVIIDQPVKQVVTVGAKFKYTGGPLSDEQINALGQCESGMTATRNSGNGFYGAFQFMPQTWSSVAPEPYRSSLPHQAPLEAQKQAVQNLLGGGSSIYTQFPGCARKMQAQGIL